MVKYCLAIAVALGIGACIRQPIPLPETSTTPFLNEHGAQVDSLLLTMSIEEKIGQLLIYNNEGELSNDSLYSLVNNGLIGGIKLSKSTIESYIDFSDSLRKASSLPLFFSTLEKFSLFNHFTDLPNLPSPQTLSNIDSVSLINELKDHYYQQCEALGVNMVISLPFKNLKHPSQPYDIEIFQDELTYHENSIERHINQINNKRILAIGDDLINWNNPNIDSLQLEEIQCDYHKAIEAGIAGFQLSNTICANDSLENLPFQFASHHFQRDLNFNGLMVGKVTPESSIDKLWYAGNDVFLVSDIEASFSFLKKIVSESEISYELLNNKVRKILQAKTWINGGDLLKPLSKDRVRFVSLNDRESIESSSTLIGENKDLILEYFQHPSWEYFVEELYEHAIILANNHKSLLPYTNIYKRDFRIIQYGGEQLMEFKKYFSKYAYYASYLKKPNDFGNLPPLNYKSFRWSTPIVILDHYELHPRDNADFIQSINDLAAKSKAVLINFGDPRNLEHFDSTLSTIQIAERTSTTEALAAQLLFGGISAKGKLPIALNGLYELGSGNQTKVIRMEFAQAEEVGISSAELRGIDRLANEAILNHATPGCQILVAKNSKIIYSKSFGHHTYKKRQHVNKGDLYDLASITKIAATTVSAMKLNETKEINLNSRLDQNIDLPEKNTIGKIPLKKLFIHQSGLQPHMPISRYISRKDSTHRFCSNYFCKEPQDSFSVRVADSLFFASNHVDSIWASIYQLPQQRWRKFRYSDVNFNILQKVVETKAESSIDEYSSTHFFQPLGLRRTMYKPLKEFEEKKILPTEDDVVWRRELVRGFVHDESAALFGGVGGNAGLFSNAEDLSILFQMLLNGGEYGGKRFLKKETIDLFTNSTHGNHRGLGFDKPHPRKYPAYAADASDSTYGHTGFTGTCVWVDPEHDLIFIFLSNRIHPDIWNRRLFKNKYRSRIHQVVYNSMDSFSPKLPTLDLNVQRG